MFEQKFAFLLMFIFVHMRQFHCDFYGFFDFLDGIFVLNGFSNPFIVPSRSSFLFNQ